jgi:AraC-like DNA-binding protein
MPRISFQLKKGRPSLGLLFCWKLTVDADQAGSVSEIMIPELFYDFWFIQNGGICYSKSLEGGAAPIPGQTLKTIHTRPLTLVLHLPLMLFGARLSMQFAESFWEPEIPSTRFLEQTWFPSGSSSLDDFACHISETIQHHRSRKVPEQMLTSTFEESDWLRHFSPRHKRRLYKSVFGVSRKEIDGIRGLHTFLGRTCDFTAQRPRIIEYIDDDVFYDQPHLNHMFRKMTGLSPIEYLMANSILQDNLMAASYNEIDSQLDTMEP